MDWSEVVNLDKQLLLAVNGSDCLFTDSLAMTLTAAITWIPLYIALLYVVIRNNENMRQIVALLLCVGLCVFFTGTLNDALVKPYVARPRPTQDLEIGMLTDVVNGYRGGRFGFFSSHAANTFSVAVLLSLIVRHRWLTIALVVWSGVNCWTRLYLGVHYPGDVLCGLLWGGVVGFLVYLLYNHISARPTMRFVSSQYTASGYLYDDVNVVLSVLGYTFVYAILRACIV